MTWNIYFFENLTFRTLENSLFLRLGQVLATISLLFIPIYAIVVFRKIDPENSFLDVSLIFSVNSFQFRIKLINLISSNFSNQIQKLVVACRPNLKWFTESELLYNEKYNTNLEDYLEKANRYNHLRLNGNIAGRPNNAQPKAAGKSDSYTRPELVQSNLLNQSKITYSIVQNLDKETTI